MPAETLSPDVPHPSFPEAVRTWAKIGVLSFGGPAGQIALMHRILVDEKKWIDEPLFLSALNFCMLLPGPEAMQLATFVGWRLHGVRGGLAAGLLFVLPGALLILALALAYAMVGPMPITQAMFLGVKAAVVAIVVEALVRVARRALKGRFEWMVAGAAFAAIFLFSVPFPAIIAGAAALGLLRGRAQGHLAPSVELKNVRHREALGTAALWLVIWIVPLGLLSAYVGRDHILAELALFYSKLAVVTFGGAYAVLAYMAQQVVEGYRWLSAGEMLDALGLAETTPGPLILVTEFVGVLSAYRHGGGPPVLMGVLGALVTLWATFAPCFLWIFAGAPYVAWINAQPQLKSALGTVTAAVVGVILNLSLWFGLHVLFAEVRTVEVWPLSASVPQFSSARWDAVALSALAFLLLFGFRRGILTTLAICGSLAFAFHVFL